MLQRGTYVAEDGSTFVKWCGLLINTSNLELQADYTRYAGLPLSSTLTVPLFKVVSNMSLTASHSKTAALSLVVHSPIVLLLLSLSARQPSNVLQVPTCHATAISLECRSANDVKGCVLTAKG